VCQVVSVVGNGMLPIFGTSDITRDPEHIVASVGGLHIDVDIEVDTEVWMK
jgi:hypothetical protein